MASMLTLPRPRGPLVTLSVRCPNFPCHQAALLSLAPRHPPAWRIRPARRARHGSRYLPFAVAAMPRLAPRRRQTVHGTARRFAGRCVRPRSSPHLLLACLSVYTNRQNQLFLLWRPMARCARCGTSLPRATVGGLLRHILVSCEVVHIVRTGRLCGLLKGGTPRG